MKTTLLLGMLLLAAGSAAAQPWCLDPETALACLNRLSALPARDGAEEKAALSDTKKKTETGDLDPANGLSSSVKDFLPLLRFTGVLGDFTKDDDTGTISVAINTPLLGSKDPAFQAKALIETKPKLFDPLKQGLPAEKRDEIMKTLLDVTNRQNVTVQLAYNITNQSLGRSFGQYQSLVDNLFIATHPLIRPVETLANALLVEISEIVTRPRAGAPASDTHNPAATLMKDLPAEKRTQVETALALGRASGALKLRGAFDETVRKSGLRVLGQLINNQPQLHFTWSKAFRDPLYGPNAFSGRVTYEMGLGNNLNELRSRAAGKCDDDAAADAAGCLAALAAFAGRPSTKAAIKAGTRLAIFAEFTQVDAYSEVIDDHNVNVAFDKGTSWSAGVDFGRLVGVDDDGAASARVDGSFRYEKPANEFLGNERAVGSLTLTKKFGDVSVPFGIVYANKPEFLKGVDHELSAHLGVKFNLFPGR
ncbi:MAG: hypothetical protein Q8N51_03310 [Gammaproteobacteria bacterium]|nr:hypothetical protein [Gammaproteobacteria bacterium]